MKFKNAVQKKRLLNELYIKVGIIKAGNDSQILKNQVKKIIERIKKL